MIKIQKQIKKIILRSGIIYISTGGRWTPVLATGHTASAHAADSSIHVCSTISLTFWLYSRLSRSYSWAAAALAGDAGLGSLSSDCIEVRMAAMSYIGDHWFCRISRHILPSW
jgi:hypothetical protein